MPVMHSQTAHKADFDANDSTARDTAGSLVYALNTTTGRFDVYIYYQAKDVAAAAIVLGSVLSAASILFTTGTGDRAGGSAIGSTTLGLPFLGICQATMTVDYYGYAKRNGYQTGVDSASAAVGDTLVVSATDLKANLASAIMAGPTAAQIQYCIGSKVGVALTTGTTPTVLLEPTNYL